MEGSEEESRGEEGERGERNGERKNGNYIKTRTTIMVVTNTRTRLDWRWTGVGLSILHVGD